MTLQEKIMYELTLTNRMLAETNRILAESNKILQENIAALTSITAKQAPAKKWINGLEGFIDRHTQ